MVHALREAHRVLRPGGLLVDLRPAAKHRRIGLGQGRRWRLVGVMRETFDEDHAANRAVARVVRDGLFQRQARAEFGLDRVMDRMEDFHRWLEEFGKRRTVAAHGWLIRRLERALVTRPRRVRIVARGPMTLQVLRRLG
jgi:SAM-dependent methyltransferase